jgi:leucyl aminopeptidase
MSYTKLNYPAAFATEGDPTHGGFPGDMDPYVHGVNDTMDVDDDSGYFSIDVGPFLFFYYDMTVTDTL